MLLVSCVIVRRPARAVVSTRSTRGAHGGGVSWRGKGVYLQLRGAMAASGAPRGPPGPRRVIAARAGREARACGGLWVRGVLLQHARAESVRREECSREARVVSFGGFRRIDLVRLWSSARWLVETRRLRVVRWVGGVGSLGGLWWWLLRCRGE